MSGLKFTVETKGLKELGQRMARAAPRAAHTLAVQVMRDTEQYVPARNKSLANQAQVDGNTIIYPGPYAHYLYVGKLFIDPNTGSAWARAGATKVITGKDLNISRAVHGKAQSHWFEASKAQNFPKWRVAAAKAVQRELRR